MMGVSSCMMLANRGEIAFIHTLGVNRGGAPLIVFGAWPELFEGIFRQIMMEGEKENPHMVSVSQNAPSMLIDRMKMLEYMVFAHSR